MILLWVCAAAAFGAFVGYLAGFAFGRRVYLNIAAIQSETARLEGRCEGRAEVIAHLKGAA